MKAIILAAGMGIRLRPLTDRVPKCLLEVNGKTILENCLDKLKMVSKRFNINSILIVVGHLKEKIMDKIGNDYEGIPIEYVYAENYATTNNIVSLWTALTKLVAKAELDDILLLESDVYFGNELIWNLFSYSSKAVVSKLEPGMNGTVVKVDPSRVRITEMLPKGDGLKTVNIYNLKKDFVTKAYRYMDAAVKNGYTDRYYETVFADLIAKGEEMHYQVSDNWAEVDDVEDLKKARFKFADVDGKYNMLSEMHGYFWPYGMTDHCHLYNMYFPEGLMNFYQENLKNLVSTYPSGQKELCYFLSEWLQINPDYLAIGNGASEIIRIINENASGVCISTPSFNEFEERCNHLVKVPLDETTWEFDPEVFLQGLKDATHGVIITPNNPTSIKVKRDVIEDVLQRTKTPIIVDESFLEFTDEPSCLELLDKYKHLIVLKSLGKVYGICGLRLGYIASSGFMPKYVRGKLPIWNVNNFAETFLRQIHRYERHFKNSFEQTKADRDEFYSHLSKIEHIKVWKPDGNFILCKTINGEKVAKELLKHNILVKHCGGKTMNKGHNYLRIGCRTPAENTKLCNILSEIA